MKFTLTKATRLLLLVGAGAGIAGVASKAPRTAAGPGLTTQQDLQGLYGETFNHRRTHNGKIAKLDLDGDFNYDGVISNDDPADNGLIQTTPPGLVLGQGEATRLLVRLSPYQLDVRAQVRFELTVRGINRAVKSGEFSSIDEELSSVGHVRVYADAEKKRLLLDSSKADSRSWSVVMQDLTPDSILNSVPRALFVEGVTPSMNYDGDVRIMARIVDTRADDAETQKGIKAAIAGLGFRPSFDHILLTVSDGPHRKAYVNGNVEKIWSNN